MYKYYKTVTGENGIKLIGENTETFIPQNPDNTDYQAYLKWLAEGNTPLPAENA
jgi:hypothetical protein